MTYLKALLLWSVSSTLLASNLPHLTLYSAREESLITPILKLYQQQTGQEIRAVTAKADDLLQRLKAEGKHSQADLLITVDAGDLWFASRQGLLAKTQSAILTQNIPEHLRDPDYHWFGLSVRARTLVYNTTRVSADELVSYPQLAAPQWHKRLCLRTSQKVYNQSLVAMLINQYGVKTTESFVKGWVNNLAQPPLPKDSAVIKAIESGACDIGIINSYYLGRHQLNKPDTQLKLFWPTKEKNGVHINISGAGITRHSPNKAAATRFLEWLTETQAQYLFARLNMEYPANPKVAASDIVKAWGSFDADNQNLMNAGRLQKYATRLMERAGYN
jgi:iron(III) transport system substrate-binding protein